MTNRRASDSDLLQLLRIWERLLEATHQWSRGANLGCKIDSIRHAAIRLNHLHYAESIPVYQRLVEVEGVGEDADLDTLINRMTFPDDLFKSYEQAWLESANFERMTEWLAGRFDRLLQVGCQGISSIHAWRERLRQHQIYLMYSTGTTGKFSFVPRDPLTLRAMGSNGVVYLHPVWPSAAEGGYPKFDCLVLGPRGNGFGIQSAGTSLARAAVRSHFLFDVELTADMVRAPNLDPDSGNERRGSYQFHETIGIEPEAAYAKAVSFVRQLACARRPLIVFGAPFQIKNFCNYVAATAGVLRVSAESIIVSGGGWKVFRNEKISRSHLLQLAQETLGVPNTHVIDTYSTVELNCVIMSCSASRYHVPPLIEPVVFDEALTGMVGAGGTGVLGFLDPFARSYPGFVITGDRGTLVHDRCDCGLAGWSIVGEIERTNEPGIKGCGGVLSSVLA